MRKLILAPTGSGFNKVIILDAVPYFRVVFVQKAQHAQVISVRHLISGQALLRREISCSYLMSSRVFMQRRDISVRLQRSQDILRERDTSNLGKDVHTLKRYDDALAYPKITFENQGDNIVHPPLP
jgi:predicted choloylglycine hydrolase